MSHWFSLETGESEIVSRQKKRILKKNTTRYIAIYQSKLLIADLEAEKVRRTEAMEAENKHIAKTNLFEPMVTLNVGGQIFTTATATLKRFPSTLLGTVFSGRHALKPDSHHRFK